ncbi:MAG: hypothetical protein KBS64_07915 [Treponema sp.]|nr:hypothetical protein [Candidatus Treponema equi]
MKRSFVSKLICVSLFSVFTAFAFAQTEEIVSDKADANLKFTDIRNVGNEEVEKDIPEEDKSSFGYDSSGNYARDSEGNRVRVGHAEEPVAHYVQRIRNIIEIEKDDLRLVLNGDEGTYALYAVSEKGDYIPLLSTYDGCSSSYFVVKVGKKEYKLQSKIGIKTEARNTPLGAQMAYLISDEVQVVLDFSFMPSIATSSRIDMLRVTVFVINIGRSIQSFAVKGVFDTVLGENSPAHFSTASRKSINSEIQFQAMDEDLWIRSSNKDAAVQFLLGGNEISRSECVTLSTRDKMDSVTWIPSVQTSKSFNSVTSFNNSALCINWPAAYLDTFRTTNYGFYISVATGGNNPAGNQFLIDLANGKTALGLAAKNSGTKISVPPKPIPVTKEELDSVTPNILNNLPASSKEAFVKTKEISEAQLDPDYIQDLLDRIATFKDDESVEQAEYRALNEELDSILKKLGAGR